MPRARLHALAFLAALLPALAACTVPPPAVAPAPVAASATPSRPEAPRPEAEATLAPELRQRLDALADSVEHERTTLHVPGLALAIVQDDRVIFARGFGQADVESARAVTPETIFAIGSTTKAFTATLVGMLADEHKLGFDDPITKTLPWFTLPVRGEGPVCLRDLMSHRTGFSRMDVLWYGGKASAEEVLRTAIGAEPIAPFQKEFHYNNVMFLAAGEACATVAGTTWEELLRARILGPLGMSSTSTSVRVAQQDPRLALGYNWDDDEKRFVRAPMRALEAIAPAGAINSNVLDLTHWVRFLLGRGEFEGRRLIGEDHLAETWKPANTVAPAVSYGLGWFLREWHGEKEIEHGGNIDGFAAEIALLPSRNTGLVMLSNVSATPLQGSIAPEVFAALFDEPASADAAPAPAAGEDLARYVGTYRANFFQFRNTPFEVSLHDGKLAVNVPSQTTFELGPPDEDGKRPFALLPDQIQVSFTEVDGHAVALVLYQGGFAFECFRDGYEPPPELAPGDAEPFLGAYADALTKKTLHVVLSHGRLAVDYPDQMVYELLPPDDLERWLFRANAQLAVEFRDDHLVFFERGTERVCKRVGEAGPLPTLDELMTLRHADAFEARLAELGICRLAGTIRFVNCGIRGTTASAFDAGDRFHDETDLAPYVTTSSTYDGARAWAVSSFEGEHELKGDNLDQARAGSSAVLFGDWRRRFDSARVRRATTEEGRELVQVELVKGAAPSVLVTLDRASGDFVRAEVQELADGAGQVPMTLTFEDWRDVEGLRLPMRVITSNESSGRVVMEYAGLETHLDETALVPVRR